MAIKKEDLKELNDKCKKLAIQSLRNKQDIEDFKFKIKMIEKATEDFIDKEYAITQASSDDAIKKMGKERYGNADKRKNEVFQQLNSNEAYQNATEKLQQMQKDVEILDIEYKHGRRLFEIELAFVYADAGVRK